MSIFRKYPSIEKVNSIKKAVKNGCIRNFVKLDNNNRPIFKETKKLVFKGTVKLHGTNACVIINDDLTTDVQSRTRILSLISDNHNFAFWFSDKKETFINAYKDILKGNKSVYIYGEWCGGSIQKNVGLANVDNAFVIFSILVIKQDDTEEWLSEDSIKSFSDKEQRIYNIYDFKCYDLILDLNNIDKGLEIADKYRDEIDLDCPVAKKLGSLVDNNGEGNVWRCITDGFEHLSFKHKGKSHERKSDNNIKIEKAALTDEEQLLLNSFIEKVLTIDRLMQAIEFLKEQSLELSKKNVGSYMRWIQSDIKKECSDELKVLIKNGIELNVILKSISLTSKEFYFKEIQ